MQSISDETGISVSTLSNLFTAASLTRATIRIERELQEKTDKQIAVSVLFNSLGRHFQSGRSAVRPVQFDEDSLTIQICAKKYRLRMM